MGACPHGAEGEELCMGACPHGAEGKELRVGLAAPRRGAELKATVASLRVKASLKG